MRKFFISSLLIACTAFGLNACGDSSTDDESCTKDATRCNGNVIETCDGTSWKAGNDCSIMDGIGEAGCFMLDKAAVCKPVCAKEGENDAACYQQGSHSTVAKKTCAKDENGKLYVSKVDIVEDCDPGLCKDAACEKKDEIGCTKDATRCNGNVIETCDGTSWKAGNDCSIMDGIGEAGCFMLDKAAVCKPVCAKEGENDAACYQQGSHSTVAKKTCAKDENGKLYVSKVDIVEDCDPGLCKDAACEKKDEIGCTKDATRCNGNVIETCDGTSWKAGNDCSIMDGIGEAGCFMLDKAAVCKPVCAKEGENDAACYQQGSHSTVAKKTCAKDENGKLYVSKIDIVEDCDPGLCKDAACEKKDEIGCTKDATRCNGNVIETCDGTSWQAGNDCSKMDGIGEAGCFMLDKAAVCKPVCAKEGENDAACYQQGSHSTVAKKTCAKDENGKLYVSKVDIVEDCDPGLCKDAEPGNSAASCDESDKCEPPMVVTIFNDISTTVTQKVDTVNLTDAANAVQECTEFTKQMESVVDKYKDIKVDELNANWEDFKDAPPFCKIYVGLSAALLGNDFRAKYQDMSNATTYCTSVDLEGVKDASAGLSESMITISGWYDFFMIIVDVLGTSN